MAVDKEWIKKWASKDCGFIALDDEFAEELTVSDDIKKRLQNYETNYLLTLPEELHFKFIHEFRVMSSRILLRVSLMETHLQDKPALS
jgi:hypothetical protein